MKSPNKSPEILKNDNKCLRIVTDLLVVLNGYG